MKRFRNIYVEIANVCNLDCSFCPKTSRLPRAMTLAEFSCALERVVLHSEFIYLHVVGEPLLHPQFDEILTACDKKGARIKLTTNGTLLKKNLGCLISHTCIKAVNISLSCIKDFDDERTQNYLEEVFFAAKLLSKNKITTILRLWTDTKNIVLVEKMIKNEFSTKILLTDCGFKKISDHLLYNIENEFVWPVNSAAATTTVQNSGVQNNCLGLRKQLAVLSDGTVVPCCLDNDGQLALGNIFEQPLQKIISAEKAQKIAQGFANSQAVEPLCKTCTFSRGKDSTGTNMIIEQPIKKNFL